MFDKIVYISDHGANIKLNEGVALTQNLMNLHIVFEDDKKKILGEVDDLDGNLVKARFLGEIVNGKLLGGTIRKPSLDAKIRKAKVLKINGILVEKLLDEYEKCVSFATYNHLYAMIENNFNILEVLYSLPSFKRDNLLLKVETDKGMLSIDTKNSLKECLLERKDTKPNYYIQDKALIFTYQSCHPYYIPVIDSLLKVLDRETKNQNITKFVLDLRGNGGGASAIIKPLIEYLKNTNLELVTIVDKGVFSSGRFACVAMQMIGSKVVGEQIGTPINCFGNVLRPPVLTNTTQQPIFAKTYWYLDDDKEKMVGINEKKELLKYDKDFFKPKFLELDEEYTETLTDFVNDYDIFLKKALANQTKIK